MALGTLISRVLGMIRSPILLTLVVGLNSPIASSFDVANQLPNIVFNIIAGGLINAVLVPAIVQAAERDKGGDSPFINKLITIAIIILGAITTIITICAPLVVKAFASTMTEEWYQVTVIFAYWCLPQIFFYGMYAVLGQILNARESFGPYTWAPVVNNIVAIVGFVIILLIFKSPTPEQTQDIALWTGARQLMLAIFSTAGVVAQALVLFIPLRRVGIHYRPDFHWRGTGLGTAGKASFWVLMTTLTGTVTLTVMSNVNAGTYARAQELGIDPATVAGNAAHTVANSIYYLPISLVAVSITTATFTKISRAAAKKDLRKVTSISAQTTNILSTFMLLASVLMLILAYPLARIFVPGGSEAEIQSLARIIMLAAFTVPPSALTLVYKNICFAFNDTRGAFFMILPSQVLNTIGILLCALLPPQYTVAATEIVFFFGNSLSTLCLMYYSRKIIGRIGGWYILRTHLYLVIVSVICALIGFFAIKWIGFSAVSTNMLIAALTIIAATIVITALYILLGKLFRISQVNEMYSLVQKAIRTVIGKVFARTR